MPNWKSMSLDEKLGLQNMYVEITSRQNCISKGNVFAVDPVTESVVIETKLGLDVVVGHFIEKVAVLNKEKEICTGFDLTKIIVNGKDKTLLSQKDILNKKTRLLNWFKNNSIEVQMKKDKIYVFKVAYIEPPYTTDSCYCKNLKMLHNVKKLVKEFST